MIFVLDPFTEITAHYGVSGSFPLSNAITNYFLFYPTSTPEKINNSEKLFFFLIIYLNFLEEAASILTGKINLPNQIEIKKLHPNIHDSFYLIYQKAIPVVKCLFISFYIYIKLYSFTSTMSMKFQ